MMQGNNNNNNDGRGGNGPGRGGGGGKHPGGNDPDVIPPSDSEESENGSEQGADEDEHGEHLFQQVQAANAQVNEFQAELFDVQAGMQRLWDNFGDFRGLVLGQIAGLRDRLGHHERWLVGLTVAVAFHYMVDFGTALGRFILRLLGYDW